MAIASPSKTRHRASLLDALPPLEPGDHLDQKTFHARYEAMRNGVRAELIGGVVIMPSPAKRIHSRSHIKIGRWLDVYEDATPGVEANSGGTTILGDESEPMPDVFLVISPVKGGQTKVDRDGYVVGAPELIAEISYSTESYDLHGKKSDYEKAGVCEYVVVALRQKCVFWFVRKRGKFHELAAGTDGVLRSQKFPGLWLDPAALLRLDGKRVMKVLNDGLASPEHAAFVAKLAAK